MKEAFKFIFEVLKVVVLALLIVLPIRYFIFQPFIVKGASMEPAFHDGDYLIVDEISYHLRNPKRGEVAILKNPDRPSVKFIKRVIGLPNERLEFHDSKITVTTSQGEKKALDETYLPSSFSTEGKEVYLSEDEYYVLGDNRAHSYDSRRFGPIKEKYFIGRALFRVFPPNAAAYFTAPSY